MTMSTAKINPSLLKQWHGLARGAHTRSETLESKPEGDYSSNGKSWQATRPWDRLSNTSKASTQGRRSQRVTHASIRLTLRSGQAAQEPPIPKRSSGYGVGMALGL
eukprot:593567-Pelagomonas_calceolata.AAC.2